MCLRLHFSCQHTPLARCCRLATAALQNIAQNCLLRAFASSPEHVRHCTNRLLIAVLLLAAAACHEIHADRQVLRPHTCTTLSPVRVRATGGVAFFSFERRHMTALTLSRYALLPSTLPFAAFPCADLYAPVALAIRLLFSECAQALPSPRARCCRLPLASTHALHSKQQSSHCTMLLAQNHFSLLSIAASQIAPGDCCSL
jgi:hypothetical protein